jgi:hypothetical protein
MHYKFSDHVVLAVHDSVPVDHPLNFLGSLC